MRIQTRYIFVPVALVAALVAWSVIAQQPQAAPTSSSATVRDFGARGDGRTDDTEAVQRAVDAGIGVVRFPSGRYRLTRPISIELEKVGYTAIVGDGAAQLIMAGAGPALRFVGTHQGTASPRTVNSQVWERERSPSVDGIEIVGDHPEACGVEATGTMQLMITRLSVRKALHAVHLTKRNRNVTLNACNLYNNRGIGVFLDGVNLHQINIIGCHISYNHGGGIVARDSELRNLQVGSCDIEANMGGPGSPPTANILLERGSLAEVAIVGCSIQHSHDAPDSANIRIDAGHVKLRFTDELRWGHVTIASNVLSDVHVNLDLKNLRGATITGNTMWQAYTRNVTATNCANLVFSDNLCERNPRYHGGDAAKAHLGLVFTDCSDCTFSGNHLQGNDREPAALVIKNGSRINITGCTILDFGGCGLLLENLRHSRISDCLIRGTDAAQPGIPLQLTSGSGNQIVDNQFSHEPQIADGAALAADNLVIGAD
jgi:uncharacterized protein YjbI with pentapeptide repeats